MAFVSRVALAAALFIGSSVPALADSITAVGQGWCSSGGCNSSSVIGLSNTFAGSHESGISRIEYRDWFAFDIPELSNITSATLNIWNDERNFTDLSTANFELRDASDHSFAGLFGTVTLGSIAVAVADTRVASGFVSIALNAQALALLNGSAGGRFLFGGIVTPFDPGHEVQIFGYTQGTPPAMLDLTGDPAPVPEPSTVLLMMTGALALGASARSRRAVALRLRRR